MTVTPDEKAVIDALKKIECAPFTEFSRLCAERDRLREENDHLRQYADRGDFLVYRVEWDALNARADRYENLLREGLLLHNNLSHKKWAEKVYEALGEGG